MPRHSILYKNHPLFAKICMVSLTTSIFAFIWIMMNWPHYMLKNANIMKLYETVQSFLHLPTQEYPKLSYTWWIGCILLFFGYVCRTLSKNKFPRIIFNNIMVNHLYSKFFLSCIIIIAILYQINNGNDTANQDIIPFLKPHFNHSQSRMLYASSEILDAFAMYQKMFEGEHSAIKINNFNDFYEFYKQNITRQNKHTFLAPFYRNFFMINLPIKFILSLLSVIVFFKILKVNIKSPKDPLDSKDMFVEIYQNKPLYFGRKIKHKIDNIKPSSYIFEQNVYDPAVSALQLTSLQISPTAFSLFSFNKPTEFNCVNFRNKFRPNIFIKSPNPMHSSFNYTKGFKFNHKLYSNALNECNT